MFLGHLGREGSHRMFSKQVEIIRVVSRVKSDKAACVIVCQSCNHNLIIQEYFVVSLDNLVNTQTGGVIMCGPLGYRLSH